MMPLSLRSAVVPLSLILLLAPVARAQDTGLQAQARADGAFSAKRYADAIPLYRQVVSSKAPASVRARAESRIAYSQFYLKDLPAARKTWLSVVEAFPKQAGVACDALVRSASVAIGSNDYSSAAADLERAVKDYGSSAEARPSIAEALSRLGKVYLHQAEGRKADALRTRAATDPLEQAWSKAAPDYDKSRQTFERLVRDYAEFPEWVIDARTQLIALKYEYALGGNVAPYTEVVTAADAFLKDYPGETVHTPMVRMLRAEANFQLGHYDACMEDIRIIQDNLADTTGQALGSSMFLYARCWEAKGDLDRAILEYQKFLDSDKPSFLPRPERAMALFLQARCHERLGETAEALQGYNKVVADYPEDGSAQMARMHISTLRSTAHMPGP